MTGHEDCDDVFGGRSVVSSDCLLRLSNEVGLVDAHVDDVCLAFDFEAILCLGNGICCETSVCLLRLSGDEGHVGDGATRTAEDAEGSEDVG